MSGPLCTNHPKGRVSMLAALGFIVGEQLEDFPAFFNFDGHIQVG